MNKIIKHKNSTIDQTCFRDSSKNYKAERDI